MSKQEVVKMQTCVLRVNIHCHGCENKVRKLLRRTEGVYTAEVDGGQGLVTVTGNVDPGTLIRKLERSGKHAELWSAPKDGSSNSQNQHFNEQLENIMKRKMESHGKGGGDGPDGKLQKGGRSRGGGNGKEDQLILGGFGQNQQQLAAAAAYQAQLQQHMMNMKVKGVKPPSNQRNVELKVLENKPDMGSDDHDEEELDDQVKGHERAYSDEYGHIIGHQEAGPKQQGDGGNSLKVVSTKKSKVVDEKWCGKKGGVFDLHGLMKALGKGGGDGKKRREARKDGGSSGGDRKINSNEEGGGKKKKKKKKKKNSKKMQLQQPEFSSNLEGASQMMIVLGRGVDVGSSGSMSPMGHHSGSYPAVQGLPGGGGSMRTMNHHHHQQKQQLYDYGGHNNNNGETDHPTTMLMYAGSHPPPPPMPPPSTSNPFLYMFSDDNTNSCSVM